jgi:hypothetical protein
MKTGRGVARDGKTGRGAAWGENWKRSCEVIIGRLERDLLGPGRNFRRRASVSREEGRKESFCFQG